MSGSSVSNDGSPFGWPPVPSVRLSDLGAEPEMTEMERETRRTVRQFAEKVMRPIGAELDRMSPQEVVAAGSPYWKFRDEFAKLGLFPSTLMALSPEERGRMFPIVMEEMGWGDAGLTIVTGASALPPLLTRVFNREFLIERYPETMGGCWAITEPDHGSDSLDVSRQAFHPEGNYGRPNCVASIRGDKVVINGQKSAWVSNAPAAEVCVLYCASDSGSGPDTRNGCVVIVPLDAKGVGRGKPLDKMGQRALPQGELFFDDVELSTDYIVAGPKDYQRAVHFIHCDCNVQMAGVFTGVARAAYEHAFSYAHQRKQGGVPIIRHQAVAMKLFHMFRKIEASRALCKRVSLFNATAPVPSLQAAMAAKITGTQTAFDVASEAIQILGGNGVTREYPLEKIFRDARSSLIEDGCNDLLAIKAGMSMIDPDLY